MQKTVLSVFLFLVSLVFFSCIKKINNETINEIPTTTNASTGTISGTVFYYDPILGYLTTPLKGATISIDSTKISAVSDSNGFFTLKNVPAGTYTITYTKDSFGIVKTFNFFFPGNGEAYLQAANLHNIPFYTFQNLQDSVNISVNTLRRDTSYFLNAMMQVVNSDPNHSVEAMIVFGLKKDININDPTLISTTFVSGVPGIKLFYFSAPISNYITLFRRYSNMYHGATIYMKIYPISYYYNNYAYDYTDPIKGIQFTSLGSPISGQFILP